ncbi:MAG: hypothetical protein NZ533_09195 [Casimicrobiaceae bacterium]|nr:hypothetical protein [Casimicrobiaceae bacterium]
MTLVELMLAIAIATLLSLAGWRAIEVLQHAREQTRRDAELWQRFETLFERLESDLRRADLTRFDADPQGLRFQLLPLTPGAAPTPVAYEWLRGSDDRLQLRRRAGADQFTLALEVEAQQTEFTSDGRTWSQTTTTHPIALRIRLRLSGGGEVERLLVLR